MEIQEKWANHRDVDAKVKNVANVDQNIANVKDLVHAKDRVNEKEKLDTKRKNKKNATQKNAVQKNAVQESVKEGGQRR